MTIAEMSDMIMKSVVRDKGDKSFNRSCYAVASRICRRVSSEGASTQTLSDAQRREGLIKLFDDKLQDGSLTAQEVDRYMMLCGLDRKSQDIVVEIVDFSSGLWRDDGTSGEDIGVVAEDEPQESEEVEE